MGDSHLIKQYDFTRRALNASYSNRTCKLGSMKGTLKQAIKHALELSDKEGHEISVIDRDDNILVGCVWQYKSEVGKITLLKSHTKDMMELVS